MLRHWYIAPIVLAFTLALVSQPAHACFENAPLKLEDVKYADVVVIGRVLNYRIIPDLAAVETRKRMLADPTLSPEIRNEIGKIFEKSRGSMSDYGRFDVQVQEVLKGKVPARIAVTWNNSTFSEPEKMAEGPFLIAARFPDSKSPPLRGPSATVLPNKEPDVLTLLQAPCAPAFIFPIADTDVSTDARYKSIVESIRRILREEDNPSVSESNP